MADKKITALNAIGEGQVDSGDLLHVVDDPQGTPVNKKMTLATLFNNIPTFLALDSVEALNESTFVSAGISVSNAITTLDFTGQSGSSDISGDLPVPSHEGQIKVIIRKKDDVSGVGGSIDVPAASNWVSGASNTAVAVMESNSAMVLVGVGSTWYPVATVGTVTLN